MASDHNKIINAAARQALKPLGLKRKGSSRVWLGDLGWRVIQVEFQPSSWSKGSYLNVGIAWLLYEKSYLSFDVGYRVDTPFIEYKSDDQFEPAVARMAERAASEVAKLQETFESLPSTAKHFSNEELTGPWSHYYAGVIFGLSGMAAESHRCFQEVAQIDASNDWQKGLVSKANELTDQLRDEDQFKKSIVGIIYRARSAANLDNWKGELTF